MEGTAIQIVSVNGDHTLDIDLDALTAILTEEEIKDLPICVISVAGACRQGKSFALNYFLRFLESKGANDWLGNENLPLKGFSWRGGCDPATNGILMWSKAFIVEKPSEESDEGEKIAVILMDSQGAFDCKSTLNESAAIFALSTLLSSVQIYNIMRIINEDHLQKLQLFTEFGKLALDLDKNDEAPFQKLVFLVRDWMSPGVHNFGLEGGNEFLEKRLNIEGNQPAELQNVRQHIKSCFENIECFLMPSPGEDVAENVDCDGSHKGMRQKFKGGLDSLVTHMLAPKNLAIKTIGGSEVTAKDLLIYCKAYVELFKGGKFPEVKSLVEATIQASNQAANKIAEELYSFRMKESFDAKKSFFSEDELNRMHLEIKEEAVGVYRRTPKFGGNDYANQYISSLEEKLEKVFIDVVEHNNRLKKTISSKSFSAAAKAMDSYCSQMKCLLNAKPFYEETELLEEHLKIKEAAVKQFQEEPTIGNAEFLQNIQLKLERAIVTNYLEEILPRNDELKKYAETNASLAVKESVAWYCSQMESFISTLCGINNAEELLCKHNQTKSAAKDFFFQQQTMEDEEFIQQYINQLDEDVDEMFQGFAKRNCEANEASSQIKIYAVMESGVQEYQSRISEHSSVLDETEFTEIHLNAMSDAIMTFDTALSEICDPVTAEKFLEEFEKKIEKMNQMYDMARKCKVLQQKINQRRQQKFIVETAVLGSIVGGSVVYTILKMV